MPQGKMHAFSQTAPYLTRRMKAARRLFVAMHGLAGIVDRCSLTAAVSVGLGTASRIKIR
jgi:hypothetical protein